MRARVALIAAGLLLAVSVASTASAAGYSTIPVPIAVSPGHVCTRTLINGLNNAGTAIGTEYCGRTRVFLRSATGTVTFYRLPANVAAYTSAANIASNGDIAVAGQKTATGPVTSYIVTEADKLIEVKDPKAHGHGTFVNAINRKDVAVGYYCTNARCTRYTAFIYKDGAYRDFAPPALRGPPGTQLTGIDDVGAIAGFFFTHGGVARGFIKSGHTLEVIDSARHVGKQRGAGTFLLGMADASVNVCGMTIDRHGRARGWVEIDGVDHVIDPHSGAKHPFSQVLAINRAGEFGGGSTLRASRHLEGFLGAVG